MQSVSPLGQQEWVTRAAGLLQESRRPRSNLAKWRNAQQSRLVAVLPAAQRSSQPRRSCGLTRQVIRQRGMYRQAGHRLPRRASQCPGAQDWARQDAMHCR